MATIFYKLPFFLLLFLLPSANSVSFQISHFESNASNILYYGDAIPSVGAIEMINKVNYVCRVGWATYANRVQLWDSITKKLTNFATHYSSFLYTQGSPAPKYGHGLAFFLAPVGFEIPPDSAGGFLGLFNTTTSDSRKNQIVLVEFDSYVNVEWDPSVEHVGINKNSIASAVYTPWNASFHSGDTVDVWITYSASTKNLSVSWEYQTTSNAPENTSLFYEIDLREILPEWVTVGFSAATSQYGERVTIKSWEFSSSLDIKETNGKNAKKKKLLVGLTVSGGVLIAGAIIAFVIMWTWKGKEKKEEEETAETVNLALMNDDLGRGAGPRSFEVVALEIATGRRSGYPMEENFDVGLLQWVWNLYGRGDLLLAVDGKMENDLDEKQVECLIIVGLWCVQPDRNLRPSIRQAIRVLNFGATTPNLPT
ncbi:hypothetical protein FH972_011081 [Carpinus fangiana]|uniref:Legume lectin domain-containing protein n=1 Tax=Carpinus fangiana TaxID=176857 RepID=A0A660KS07_9ROSI|nr:hypothetical protein FH972_011081 [Carpinus fangiana]